MSKFDQVRPFLVIHRVVVVLCHFSAVYDFDAVRSSSTPIIRPRQAEAALELLRRKWKVDQIKKRIRLPDLSTHYSFMATCCRFGSAIADFVDVSPKLPTSMHKTLYRSSMQRWNYFLNVWKVLKKNSRWWLVTHSVSRAAAERNRCLIRFVSDRNAKG